MAQTFRVYSPWIFIVRSGSKTIYPFFDEVARTTRGVNFYKVDVDALGTVADLW
jgi:hypothetical protein